MDIIIFIYTSTQSPHMVDSNMNQQNPGPQINPHKRTFTQFKAENTSKSAWLIKPDSEKRCALRRSRLSGARSGTTRDLRLSSSSTICLPSETLMRVSTKPSHFLFYTPCRVRPISRGRCQAPFTTRGMQRLRSAPLQGVRSLTVW